jgi:hypothetical protein
MNGCVMYAKGTHSRVRVPYMNTCAKHITEYPRNQKLLDLSENRQTESKESERRPSQVIAS